jgi:hypothetical protein
MRGARGISLVEALTVVALAALGLLAAAPALATLSTAGRAAAGARRLAVTLQALRFRAVSTQTAQGLWFENAAGGWRWWEVRDGNGNGLRTAEVRSGVDARVAGPFRLEDRVEHARLGFPPAPSIPRIPPATGPIVDRADPVQFGRSDLVSFGPLGTSSSGTLYVSDARHRLFGVVVYGRTARVRVFAYDTRSGRWKP